MDPQQSRNAKKRKQGLSISRPEPNTATNATVNSTSRVRSLAARSANLKDLKEKHYKKHYMKYSTVINLPLTLEDLQKPVTKEGQEELENINKTMQDQNYPSQCMSARFVDRNGKTLFAYFGERITGQSGSIELSDQYKGRTKADLYHSSVKYLDGLSPQQCVAYQLAAQSLCSDLPLHTRFDRTRHEGVNFMSYATTSQNEREDNDDEVNLAAYDIPNNHHEQAGVAHLVHGWPQQGQVMKGLFISGDISHTSTSLASSGSYYFLTQPIAATISAMFEAVFPEWYGKYKRAFEAGRWMASDPGPYLGRAIIYKLQGKNHKDRHDLGPSASFGVGKYKGGEMLIPQFKAKFSYDPGHVCIFYSSSIYHKVAPFEPLAQTQEEAVEHITPGRIGTVFFFPRGSYNVLADKRAGWAYETAFGKNEKLIDQIQKKYDNDDDDK